MKKTYLLFMLLVSCVSVYAQKSYINLFAANLSNQSADCYLTGDLPAGINSYYCDNVGNILNQLAQEGYEVEFMSMSATSQNYSSLGTYVNYLLSKKTSSSNPDVVTYQRDITDDTEVYEVARFNLQGLPVNKEEKGVQIVVYSNYTTKTIIVE